MEKAYNAFNACQSVTDRCDFVRRVYSRSQIITDWPNVVPQTVYDGHSCNVLPIYYDFYFY